jgi:hypothetical protein
METKSYHNRIFFNKLNEDFEGNILLSFKTQDENSETDIYVFLITREDLLYCIDLKDCNIPSFVLNNEQSVIESMFVKELSNKSINDLCFLHFWNHCFARNSNNDSTIYRFNCINRRVNKYTFDEKIIDMCSGFYNSLFLTQSGKVYEYVYSEKLDETKVINFELKEFENNGYENERIIMISCGYWHSLALSERGRVFKWGIKNFEEVSSEYDQSILPMIIELNEIRINKICCGKFHSLLLSNDGDIYAFGLNTCGEVGNGTKEEQRSPIMLECENKFIDIASHPVYSISMSKSLDGTYYVWGLFQLEHILTPLTTKFESFEDILNFNKMNYYYKKFGKIIEFEDIFFRNGYFERNFININNIGCGSFGAVYKVEEKKINNFFAIKTIESHQGGIKDLLREYLNFSTIQKFDDSKIKHLVKHYDAWFQEIIPDSDSNRENINLYIKMELCDKTLNDIIDEINVEPILKKDEYLTEIGYYITSQIFIEILEGVNQLHQQKLIHRDLKPANILLKKDLNSDNFIKIADFGITVIHKFDEQCHTMDRGTLKYAAPEVFRRGNYNTKADVYSLGMIFHQLFDLQYQRLT